MKRIPHVASHYDVVVIGGGPAGMMAAGRAASRGLKVALVEKNATLGKKLLITGGGRCNVTNATYELRTILARYAEAEPFLYSAFSQHDVKATLDFFHSRNMPTVTEKEHRVFPQSNSAQSVWDVMVSYIREGKVTVISNSPVTSLMSSTSDTSKNTTGATRTITEAKILPSTANGNLTSITGTSFIIATGGTSRPETGSTGDAFTWLAELGHTVHPQIASLVPLITREAWTHALQGIPLDNIGLSLFVDNVRQPLRSVVSKKGVKKVVGKILFTHQGVSGPTVLNMSNDAREFLETGTVELSLDLLPAHDTGTLNAALQDLFKIHHTKKIKNALCELIPASLVTPILEIAPIHEDTACNSITRSQRIFLVNLLKDLRMTITGLLEAKAVVSSGGLDLAEVDFKTMQSRLYPNLYIVGDVLNINRPSGGYSLQLCWTTGWVAGNSAK